MNTIEQAASRLAQLRSAGVDAAQDAAPEPAIADRAVDGAPAALRAEAGRGFAGVISRDADQISESNKSVPSPQVTIDLEHLSAMGYVSPHAPSSRRAEEFRMIKRPLLNNVRGNSAAPGPQG